MRRHVLTIVFIAAGVILIIVGIALGHPAQVLTKAAKICMECVGLG
ncbi:CD1871A family CXXC motif-containing protein [Butyrivibrio sp. AE2032]|nr:CD1871A family CXXC motif-containing protein [Butyrivibrio sp. AE2032]